MTSRRQPLIGLFSFVVAISVMQCAPSVRPTVTPWDAPLAALWERPSNLETRDLFNGPWGAERAPDPNAEYTFVRPKQGGVNPGVIVNDALGREWHVKQPPHNHQGAEGPVEVVLSRVLSAVGYHQPPVYFLPSFTMRDKSGPHTEPGGRFRLHDGSMKARGDWSWQQNPFVGMRPYQGLLAILLMFNSSDLKNSNNTLYDVKRGGATQQWYVVRDLGSALGETGRLHPKRSDTELFARTRFITGVERGFVVFDYHGFHQELARDRITPDDVAWASTLLARLTERQWQDAFRAGGYDADRRARFIGVLRARIAQGLQMAGDEEHGVE
jgi:hypothetical protein